MLEDLFKNCNIIKPFSILGFLIERKLWQKIALKIFKLFLWFNSLF